MKLLFAFSLITAAAASKTGATDGVYTEGVVDGKDAVGLDRRRIVAKSTDDGALPAAAGHGRVPPPRGLLPAASGSATANGDDGEALANDLLAKNAAPDRGNGGGGHLPDDGDDAPVPPRFRGYLDVLPYGGEKGEAKEADGQEEGGPVAPSLRGVADYRKEEAKEEKRLEEGPKQEKPQQERGGSEPGLEGVGRAERRGLGPKEKSLCHKNGDEYELVTPFTRTYGVHVAHADAEVGMPVPGQESCIFAADCAVDCCPARNHPLGNEDGTEIAVPNPSFEDYGMWCKSEGDHLWNDCIKGWTLPNSGGIQTGDSLFNGGNPAHGCNNAWLNSGFTGVDIGLVDTVGTIYTLTVALGWRSDLSGPPSGNIALLLDGGVAVTSTEVLVPTQGDWIDATVQYTSTAADIDKMLSIQIVKAGGIQLGFDQVRLNAAN